LSACGLESEIESDSSGNGNEIENGSENAADEGNESGSSVFAPLEHRQGVRMQVGRYVTFSIK